MRRFLVLTTLVVLALTGCAAKSHASAGPASSTGVTVTPSASPSELELDPLASDNPTATAAAAPTGLRVSQLMKTLGCTHPELTETASGSLETGMCTLHGDVIIAVFATNANRDDWVKDYHDAGMSTVTGDLWAAGLVNAADAAAVANKLAGKVG